MTGCLVPGWRGAMFGGLGNGCTISPPPAGTLLVERWVLGFVATASPCLRLQRSSHSALRHPHSQCIEKYTAQPAVPLEGDEHEPRV